MIFSNLVAIFVSTIFSCSVKSEETQLKKLEGEREKSQDFQDKNETLRGFNSECRFPDSIPHFLTEFLSLRSRIFSS